MPSPSNFDNLALADCPLLAGDASAEALLKQFNDLLGRLRTIRDSSPRFFQSEDVQPIVHKLVGGDERSRAPVTVQRGGLMLGDKAPPPSLRDLFVRARYSVGFLGLFQVGKSTTFNRILRAVDPDKPAREGGTTRATTSCVTRLHRPGRGETATSHTLLLRYVTLREYESKRDCLARNLGLDPDQGEDVLTAELDSELAKARKLGDTTRSDNLLYLKGLLEAYRAAGRLVKESEPAHVDPSQPFSAREEILNHNPGQSSRVYAPLLREAEINYLTDVIEPELELLDMPGLGTYMLMDTIGTEYLMPQLHGVLVFYKVTSDLDNRDLSECMFRLRQHFGNLKNRVWIVFCHCDALSPAHFGSTERNALTGIDDFLKAQQLPPEQICFLTNQWHDWSAEEVEAHFKRLYGTADPLEKLNVPATSPLGAAFAELRRSGGVDRLRDLVTQTVRSAVATETRIDLENKLRALHQDLELAERLHRDQADPERQRQLEVVYQGLHRLLLVLQGRRDILNSTEEPTDYFTDAGNDLATALTNMFDTLYPEDPILRAKTLVDVQNEFDRHYQLLQSKLDDQLSRTTIKQVYQRIAEVLRTFPKVEAIGYAEGVAEAWVKQTTSDQSNLDWRRGLVPSFADPLLFRTQTQEVHGALNGITYRHMMLEKIQVTAHQVMHALELRVRFHLEAMKQAHSPKNQTTDSPKLVPSTR